MPTDPKQEPPRAQVLIVEDEQDHAEVMADALRAPGHVSTIVGGVERALDELRHGAFDIVVTDLRMPECGGANNVSEDGSDAGLVVLRAARDLQPDAETIMVTAHGRQHGAGGVQGRGVRLHREAAGPGAVPAARQPRRRDGAAPASGDGAG